MNKNLNLLKNLSSESKPIGWVNWAEDSSFLILKLYGFGEEAVSCLYFKIPLASLDRFLNGEIEGCPVFEVVSNGEGS
jgi:hypothetical protein